MTRIALTLAAATLACTAQAAYGADAQQQEQNKKAAVEFYEKAINQKDFEAASKCFGPRYTQHNPNAADGPEGLRAFHHFLKETFPGSRSEIKRVFADGDYVIPHVHAVREPGTRGNAIIDIFKLENGRIVEHWDVVHPHPREGGHLERHVLSRSVAGSRR